MSENDRQITKNELLNRLEKAHASVIYTGAKLDGEQTTENAMEYAEALKNLKAVKNDVDRLWEDEPWS